MLAAQMGLSQMPPGMMPPVGVMPPPPMAVNGDFMAMQLPGPLPNGGPQPWPGNSVPMQGMGPGCSAPMQSSIPAHHSAAGGAFPMPGRGELALPVLLVLCILQLVPCTPLVRCEETCLSSTALQVPKRGKDTSGS